MVLLISVIEYLTKPCIVIKEIRRILSEKEILIIEIPNYLLSTKLTLDHVKEYTITEILRIIKPTFRIVKVVGMTCRREHLERIITSRN